MVTPSAIGCVIVPTMFDPSPEWAVLSDLELGSIQIVAACQWAAGMSDTGVVVDILFVGNKRGVKIMVCQPWELVIVLSRLTA